MRPPDFHVATSKIYKVPGCSDFARHFVGSDGAKKKARSVYTPRAFQVLRLINCQAKRYRVVLPLLPE